MTRSRRSTASPRRSPADKLADVIVAEYHEGAGAGTPMAQPWRRRSPPGARSPGHRSRRSAPDRSMRSSPGTPTSSTRGTPRSRAARPHAALKTRPVLQTGSYGEFIGQIVLTVDTATDVGDRYTHGNVPRTTSAAHRQPSWWPVPACRGGQGHRGQGPGRRRGGRQRCRSARSPPTSPRRRPSPAPRHVHRDDRCQRVHPRQPGGATPCVDALKAPQTWRRRNRRRQPRRPARRAVLRARRHDHLRRGQRRAAVREQPVDHVPDRCAVQDDAGAAVADQRGRHGSRAVRTCSWACPRT